MKYVLVIILVACAIWLGYKLGRLRAVSRIHKSLNQKRIDEAKEKIMNLLGRKGEIRNNDVEKLLGVSDSTVGNYLEALEREGKIKQIGETGAGVYYVRK